MRSKQMNWHVTCSEPRSINSFKEPQDGRVPWLDFDLQRAD